MPWRLGNIKSACALNNHSLCLIPYAAIWYNLTWPLTRSLCIYNPANISLLSHPKQPCYLLTINCKGPNHHPYTIVDRPSWMTDFLCCKGLQMNSRWLPPLATLWTGVSCFWWWEQVWREYLQMIKVVLSSCFDLGILCFFKLQLSWLFWLNYFQDIFST